MGKLSNALRMIFLLQRKGKMRIKDIAECLEVEERMVRNYRDDIEKAGLIINTYRGRNGGYEMDKRNWLPIQNLTIEEMDALQIEIQKLCKNSSSPYSSLLKVAMDKIKAGNNYKYEEESLIHFINKAKRNPLSNESKIYEVLKISTNIRRSVKIKYYSAHNNKTTVRVINPYGFVYYDDFLYVIGYCHLKQEPRAFKLIRIKEYESTSHSFEIPSDFSMQSLIGNSFSMFTDSYNVELVIGSYPAELVKEKIWGENQEIEDLSSGDILFKAKMYGKNSIVKWILSMGTDVEVIHPEELRLIMYEKAVSISKKY